MGKKLEARADTVKAWRGVFDPSNGGSDHADILFIAYRNTFPTFSKGEALVDCVEIGRKLKRVSVEEKQDELTKRVIPGTKPRTVVLTPEQYGIVRKMLRSEDIGWPEVFGERLLETRGWFDDQWEEVDVSEASTR